MPARPSATNAARRLVSISAAADHIACSDRTIRRLIADGRLTGYRIGNRILRVDLNQLDSLLQPIPTAGGDAA